jgi:hypothetical protein
MNDCPRYLSESMLSHFVVIVHIRLDRLVKVDDGNFVVGYYKNFGVSAASKKGAQEFIAAEVTDGAIDWQEVEWRAFGCAKENPVLQQAFDQFKGEGIWYRSGRAFYPADE